MLFTAKPKASRSARFREPIGKISLANLHSEGAYPRRAVTGIPP